MLQQGLPDTLRHPAMHLPERHARVDQAAEIIRDRVAIEPHDTGPNFTGMGWQTTVIDWTKKLGTTEQAPLEAALKKR